MTRLAVNTIPGELKSIDQWVVWRRALDDGVRWSKPSFDPKTGERAYPNQPETWAPFYVAVNAYLALEGWTVSDERFDGIAIALTPELGIVGVDIDHLDRWSSSEAWDIVKTLASYSELSPSGQGYRIFCYATMPEGRRVRDYVQMGSNRIFTVTGLTLGVRPHLEHRQAEVEQVHHLWLGTEYASRSSSSRAHPQDG